MGLKALLALKASYERVSQSQSRYLVHNYENGALLRIEPVRPVRDNTMYECLAENGVGDAVSAEAQLRVYEAEKKSNDKANI
ncbi:tyrosine-protein phosphatase Lar-like [Apis dorsata]|uniref:tyrosine-protein phosphatase Lar-like n=1 Tax=Apis dorsata TaxID=7462 RepID=UPI001293237F|nr:tyrosine-protein phosphatase Lar-like [Apis dorsata]